MKEFLLILCFGSLLLLSQSKILPPGINPLTCPDYPHCPLPTNLNRILGFPFRCPNYPFCYEEDQTGIVAFKSPKLDTTCHYAEEICDAYDSEIIETLTDKTDVASCEAACKGSPACNYFTYTHYYTFFECSMLRSCLRKKKRCPNPEKCVSGTKLCQCPQLDKKPQKGNARWQCDGDLDPYTESSPVNTKCTISCATGEVFSKYKITGLTLQSTCLPGMTWSTTTTDTYYSSNLAPTTYYKFPQPDDADPQCDTCADLGPFMTDPNAELGAEFSCHGWKSAEFKKPGGFTLKSKDICKLKCNGRVVQDVRCLDGKWSNENVGDFYCFNEPAPGCPEGWSAYNSRSQGKKCVKLFTDFKTFTEANTICQAQGVKGHLLSVHSQEEMQFIRDTFKGKLIGTEGALIGLVIYNKGKSFRWTDGSPYDYSKFSSGEPESSDDSTIILESFAEWKGRSTSDKYNFLCQRPL